MLRRLPICCLILLLLGAQVGAHTVPSMVAEAEFNPAREVVLLVNLDPRLILTEQPSSVPPVPASWWFGQDEHARTNTLALAAAYVDAQLKFRVGTSEIHGTWKVQPVDGATVTPVTPSSAEVHLLVEHRGPLPEVPGDFKLTVAKSCAVPTLLVNAMAGAEQRQPQAVFPGESSRGFALPALVPKAVTGSSGPLAETGAATKLTPAPAPAPSLFSKWAPGHALWAHGLFAVAVTCVLLGRFWSALVVLLVFHGSACLAAGMTWLGWLPVKLGGMPRSCWILLGGTALALLLVRRIPPALLIMAALAGFLHGWGPWNLRLWQGVEQSCAGLFQREGMLTLVELAMAGLAVPAIRYAVRRLGIPLDNR
jgi:hypothetical protein